MNLAALWNLPCVFVIENNGYAEATRRPVVLRQGTDIAKRADGFGMPGVIVDGHDFFAVYEAAGEAIRRAREGGGPTLIECKVNRYYGHFEGDAADLPRPRTRSRRSARRRTASSCSPARRRPRPA